MTPSDAGDINQGSASARGDIVGGNKTTTSETHNHFEKRRTQIEGWLEKLATEMESDQQVQEMVESLQYYHEKFSEDGVEGLEAKLQHANRSEQLTVAIMRKEAFSKLLEKYSLYGSAQEIFAFLLSRIETLYEVEVMPYFETMGPAEIDNRIMEKVIEPVVAEIGTAPFMVNYTHVFGMVYWLAEQCFVRWHNP